MHDLLEALLRAKEVILQKEEIDRKIEAVASRKDAALEHLGELDASIERYRLYRDAKTSMKMRGGRTFTIIGSVFTIIAILLLFAILKPPVTSSDWTGAGIVLTIALPPLIVGLSLLSSHFRTKKKYAMIYENTVRKRESYWLSTAKAIVDRRNEEIAQLQKDIRRLEDRNEAALSILPEAFWTSAAIDAMMDYLETKRADGLNGAMTLYTMSEEISSLKKSLEQADKQLCTANNELEALRASKKKRSSGGNILGDIIYCLFSSFDQ